MRRLLLIACALLLVPGTSLGAAFAFKRFGPTVVALVPGLSASGTGDDSTLQWLQNLDAAPGLDYLPKLYFSADGGQSASLTVEATALDGNATTFTTGTTNLGLQPGDLVDIDGTTNYDGRWRVITAASAAATFTLAVPFSADDGANGTATHVTGGRCPTDLPQGDDDTGDGSKSAPFRSWGRALDLAERGGVNLVFDACDRWETPQGAGSDGDNESANFLLDTTQRFDLDATDAGNAEFAFCHDATGVCVAITSTIPGGPNRAPFWPVVLASMLDSASSNGFFYLSGSDADDGWLHVEGFQFGDSTNPFPTGCASATDFIYSNGLFKISVLSSDVYMCGDINNNNELWTSHNATSTPDFGVFVNTNCIYTDGGGGTDGNAPCYFNITSSSIAIIGGYSRFNKTNTSAGGGDNDSFQDVKLQASVDASNNYGFIYGHLTDFVPSDAGDADVTKCGYGAGPESADGGTDGSHKLFVARSRVIGGSDAANQNSGFWCPVNFNETNGGVIGYYGFRNASYDTDGHFCSKGGISAATQFFFREWCTVHYKGAAGTSAFFLNTNGSSTCTLWDMDIDDVLVDEADSDVGRIDAQTYTTISGGAAGFCDVAPTASGNGKTCNTAGGNVWTQCSMTDLTSDPFAGTNGVTGLAMTAQAAGACTHDVTESFGLGLYIPKYLLDSKHELRTVKLKGSGGNIGP